MGGQGKDTLVVVLSPQQCHLHSWRERGVTPKQIAHSVMSVTSNTSMSAHRGMTISNSDAINRKKE